MLDGAWGTMLQGRKLEEADYRGERFAEHARDLKGDPDLLNLTQPEIVLDVHRAVPRRGRGHHDHEHLHGDVDRPGGLRARGRRLRHERRGRIARAPGRRRGRRSLRRRVARPAEPDALALAARGGSRVPLGDLRRGARLLRGADPRLARRRRRLPPPGDDHRRAERQGRDRGRAGDRARAAALDLGDDHRPFAGARSPGRRSRRSGSRSSTRSRSSSALNCSLGATEMRPHVEELARIADTFTSCYPNAGLPNAFGDYDEQPHDTSRLLKELGEAGLVNVVGGCCGTTPEHTRPDRRGRLGPAAAPGSRRTAPRRASPGSSRSSSSRARPSRRSASGRT